MHQMATSLLETMAHKRNGQLTGIGERVKHLRPFMKGQFWKGERQATKDFVEQEVDELEDENQAPVRD